MKAILSSHNKKVLNPPVDNVQAKTCNCKKNAVCPLNGVCLTPAIVYNGHLTTETTTERYVGLCEPPFKNRHYKHDSSFRHVEQRNETALSQLPTKNHVEYQLQVMALPMWDTGV